MARNHEATVLARGGQQCQGCNRDRYGDRDRGRSRRWARLGAIGAVVTTMLVVATGGVAGASSPTYTAKATSAGAEIDLFGTQVTGGSATVVVDTSSPSVTAQGSGSLTPALVESRTATVTTDGSSQVEPKSCSQGGALPGGMPVDLSLGLACASASANLSASNLPSGSASGGLAGLDVSVAGLLEQIIQSGGNQLFAALQQVLGQLNGTPLGSGTTACPSASGGSGSSSVSSNPLSGLSGSGAGSPLSTLLGTLGTSGSPLSTLLGSLGLGSATSGNPLSGLTGGSGGSAPAAGALGNLLEGLCQTLTNVQNVVKQAQAPQTLVVKLGPAAASITGTDPNAATATASGSTADIQVLPGVGCTASSLAACIADPSAYAAPLIEIQVAPAKSVDTFDGTSWTPTSTGSLATIDLNIPGFAQSISLAAGQSQDLLAGTPLETVIDLGSASTSGTVGSANGATVDLLKGVSGGILLNLGQATTTAATGSVSPATLAGGCATTNTCAQTSPGSPQVQALASSPTAVHTGEWWSGSLPILAGLAALGGGLIGWPRLRRISAIARLLARARR